MSYHVASLCACCLVLKVSATLRRAKHLILTKRDSSWRKIYEVLAARMRKLITARARKNKRTARKDHSIPLMCSSDFAFRKYKQDSAFRVSSVLQLAKTGPLVTKNFPLLRLFPLDAMMA